MDFVEKARIMDGPRINRALARLSSEIVEENHGAGDLFLVGIRRRGVPLAERMAQKIADLEGYRPPVGVLDITLYRDDLSTVGAKPVVNRTDLPGDIEHRGSRRHRERPPIGQSNVDLVHERVGICGLWDLAGFGMVGTSGLEPLTSAVSRRRSNQLSYVPGSSSSPVSIPI